MSNYQLILSRVVFTVINISLRNHHYSDDRFIATCRTIISGIIKFAKSRSTVIFLHRKSDAWGGGMAGTLVFFDCLNFNIESQSIKRVLNLFGTPNTLVIRTKSHQEQTRPIGRLCRQCSEWSIVAEPLPVLEAVYVDSGLWLETISIKMGTTSTK